MNEPRSVEGWVEVFSSTTDFEADLVRDRLGDAGIDAVVYTQRDHAFNLTVGELAQVRVLVPPDRADEARALATAGPAPSDAELEQAALAADPLAPDAHSPEDEARLDSGVERISFEVPGTTGPDGPLTGAPVPSAGADPLAPRATSGDAGLP